MAVDNLWHLNAPPFAFGFEADGNFLYAEKLGDDNLEPRRRPSCLSGENVGKRIARRWTRLLVQIKTDRPVPVSPRTGYVHEHGGVEAVELFVPGVALVDVEPPPSVTGTLGGIGLAQ